MATIFHDALLKCLPKKLKSHTERLAYDDASRVILDSILRFALLGDQSGDDAAKSMTCTPTTWTSAKDRWRQKIIDLLFDAPVVGQKRLLDDDPSVANGQGAKSSSKKAKVTSDSSIDKKAEVTVDSSKKAKGTVVSSKKAKVTVVSSKNARVIMEFPDNQPLFTLHGVTYHNPPNQEYIDITIGTTAISLTTPWHAQTEACLDFKYAFLLPVPRFRVVLMGEKNKSKSNDDNQIIFDIAPGNDDVYEYKTTSYSPKVTITHTHNTTPLFDLFREFPSYLPSHFTIFDASRSSGRFYLETPRGKETPGFYLI